jgi:predicted outer membrane protein
VLALTVQLDRGIHALNRLRSFQMIKTLFAAAALTAAFAAPGFAMDKMACDDATIMKMEESAMAMKEPAQKDAMMMAMKEVETAKMAMKEGKTEDCMKSLENAMKATEGKM